MKPIRPTTENATTRFIRFRKIDELIEEQIPLVGTEYTLWSIIASAVTKILEKTSNPEEAQNIIDAGILCGKQTYEFKQSCPPKKEEEL